MEFGGALPAIPLAEFVFLPFELRHLLKRCRQQLIAPGGIVVRIFSHDRVPGVAVSAQIKPFAAKRFATAGLRNHDGARATRL